MQPSATSSRATDRSFRAGIRWLAAVLFMLFTSGGARANLPVCFPETGAHWPFDGNTNDASGNGHDLVAGSVGFTTTDQVFGSGAAEFDGTTHQLRYSDGTFMNDAFDQMSVGFWLKPRTLSPASNQAIYDEGGTVNGVYIFLSTTGQIVVRVREGGVMLTPAAFAFPADGNYHHIAVVYDLGQVTVYLDAVSQGTLATGFGQMAAHSSDGGFGATFGGDAGGSSDANFQGRMDDAFRTLDTLDLTALTAYVNQSPVADYGDAPASYPATRHAVPAGLSRLFLGANQADGECTTPTSQGPADGDDRFGDDEDGVLSFPPREIAPGDSYPVTVTTFNATAGPADLCGWIDFDLGGQPGDGTFEADEGACTSVAVGATSATLTFTVPADFTPVAGEYTFARLRTSTDPLTTASFGGSYSDGEVEDHPVPPNTIAFPTETGFAACGLTSLGAAWPWDGDHDDASGNGRDLVAGGSGFDAADRVTGESAALNGTTDSLRYSDGSFMNDAFDRLSFGFWMKPAAVPPAADQSVFDEGGTVNGIYVELDTGGDLVVYVQENNAIFTAATIAYPTDGDWHHVAVTYDEGDVTVYFDGAPEPTVATGFGTMNAHPSDGGFGATFGGNAGDRPGGPYAGGLDEGFRTLSVLNATEIATYVACTGDKDFGDAPASYAPAGHQTHDTGAGVVHLGAVPPDRENAAAASAAADGDDLAGDDEDGVAGFAPVMATPGSYYGVFVDTTNTTAAPVTVCGWIDFDIAGQPGQGSFEPEEGACDVSPPGGGSVLLAFTVPADFVNTPGASTIARFRISPSALTTASSGGFCPLGEVEDYEVPVDTLTPVNLVGFTATGEGAGVRVRWETLAEISNRGFVLERAAARRGPFEPVGGWIAGRGTFLGRTPYAVFDEDAPAAGPLFYRLRDIALGGAETTHGPVAVDRDGDGVGFDRELAAGFSDADPGDLAGDPDGDGVSSRDELLAGRDPRAADDGPPAASGTAGAPDGAAAPEITERVGGGVRVLEESAEALVIECAVPRFTTRPVTIHGETYRQPWLPDLVHGMTATPGRPRLPTLGYLLPAGFETVEVLEVEEETRRGIRVAPAPEFVADHDGQNVPPRYGSAPARPGGPFPEAVATVIPATAHAPARLVFHPLRAEPATDTLRFRRRVVVRVRAGATGSPASPAGFAVASQALRVAPPPGGTAALPPGPLFRLRTPGPGVYRVTGADLAAWGVDLAGVDPAGLALYQAGRERPLLIRSGGDGRFDPGDSLEFFAASSGDRYAAGEGFHLLLGSQPGRRVATASPPPGGPEKPWYPQRDRVDWKETYFATLPGEHTATRFVAGFGRQPTVPPVGTFAPARVDFDLPLDAVAPGAGPAALRLRYGAVEDFAGGPDHHHAVYFDDVPVADGTWSGNGRYTVEAEVPAGLLTDGPRRVGLEARLDGLTPAARGDQFLPLWAELTYPRRPEARAGRVRYKAPAEAARVRFTGFTDPGVTVLDVTDPAEPTRLAAAVTPDGAGGFAVTIPHDPAAPREWLAYQPGATRPASELAVRPVTRRDLRDPGTRADWLAVVPAGWEDALGALVDRRRRQGLRPLVVDIETVADEFGGGVVHPRAIRAMLDYAARHWRRAPRYLLLGGDTHMNPRGIAGTWDLWRTAAPVGVPAPLALAGGGVAPSETGDDGWYARPAPGAPAELAVGRLPAKDAAGLAALAAKLVAYETAPRDPAHRKVISVADAAEPVFERLAETRLGDLPRGLDATRLHPSLEPDIPGTLAAALGAGAGLVQYVGHGSFGFWSEQPYLDTAGAAALNQGPRAPLVLSLTCWDNHFTALPEFSMEGLGETLVRNPAGGAIAAVGAGVQSGVFAKDLFHRAFYAALFRGDSRRVGDVMRRATRAYLTQTGNREGLVEGYHLLGDPATKLRLPHPRRPRRLWARRLASGRIRLRWEAGASPTDVAGAVFRSTVAGATPDAASGGDPAEVPVLAYEVLGVEPDGSLTALGQVAGPEFTDAAFAPGDLGAASGTRRYVVRAIGPDGVASAFSEVLRVDAKASVRPPMVPIGGGSGGCAAGGRGAGRGPWALWLLALALGFGRLRPGAGPAHRSRPLTPPPVTP